MVEVLDTPLARVELLDDGIVCIEMRAGVSVTAGTARAVTRAVKTLCRSELPRPVLCDIRSLTALTASARRYGDSDEVQEVTQKLALLVSSPVSRMIGLAFLRLGRAKEHARLFDSKSEAMAWLKLER